MFICGCSHNSTNFFAKSRNFDIARKVSEIPLPSPSSIKDYDEKFFLYEYKFFNKKRKNWCTWEYLINKSTLVVDSWRYTSDPIYCEYSGIYTGAW